MDRYFGSRCPACKKPILALSEDFPESGKIAFLTCGNHDCDHYGETFSSCLEEFHSIRSAGSLSGH
jgi:hypothetical protein